MGMGFVKILVVGTLSVLSTACSVKPTYINEATVDLKQSDQVSVSNPVHFKFSPVFHHSPPKCIAVLPFKKQNQSALLPKSVPDISQLELSQLRRVLYSHLAPHSFQDVELARVDKAIAQYGDLPVSYSRIANHLSCDSLLIGEVTDYETHFLGVYSRTSVGIKLKLMRASDQTILWQGRHVASSHADSLPLTPVDIAMGLYSASSNVSDEQIIRVGDDLFRRLLVTWDKREELDAQGIEQFVVDYTDATHLVVARKLNLRSGPGMEYSAKTILNKDDVLTLMNERYNPWLQVKVADGRLGYVHERYIVSRKTF